MRTRLAVEVHRFELYKMLAEILLLASYYFAVVV